MSENKPIDVTQFEQLKKLSAKSFHQQKNLIKNVLLGKKVKCVKCQQQLSISVTSNQESSRITCPNLCTDIELEIEN